VCRQIAEGIALKMVRQCTMTGKECEKKPGIDCEYGDWEDWNACGKCGGQRKRFRHIITYAKNGGLACKPFDSEELGHCPFYCEEHGYCIWGDWGAYGPCNTACGLGKRMRTRRLEFNASKDLTRDPKTKHQYAMMMKKYLDLSKDANNLGPRNQHEVFWAFGGGFVSLAVFFVGFQALAYVRSQSSGSLRSSRVSANSHSEVE
jgi:hypothetical protein